MHFRICCCCNGEEKEKPVDRGSVLASIPTIIVTEEPKPTQPIQLDRITEVSAEESSVQSAKESKPIQVPEVQAVDNKLTESSTSTLVTQAPIQSIPSNISPPVIQITPPPTPPSVQISNSNSSSNLNFKTNIGGDSLTLEQTNPGCYFGTFKGSQFTIINGQFITLDGAYSDRDQELIMQNVSQVEARLQAGVKQMEAGIKKFTHPLLGQQFNINFTNREGEKVTMVLTLIEPGHFRSNYMGKQFSIVNGQIVTTDGDLDSLDKELILMNYKVAMLGFEQGMLGMQQGMLGMQQGMLGLQMLGMGSSFLGVNADLSGTSTSQSSYNVLATGRETLKRMRSLNHGKRTSILDGGAVATPRQMEIRDLIEKLRNYDEIDGQEASMNIPEPVLRKTTFTPNAVIYEDPKTYENLDKDELPDAKRLDEYIISVDESLNAPNRYYFHEARPRRAARRQLTPKEQLRIASPDRYSLFETESVKVHNQYRKMHGVPPLVNNEFLCQVAREWAEHLALKDAFYHRPKNDYGENLYYADGMPVCAKKAIKAWYDEIDIYDYNNPKFSKETGHFTQLVWKDTREVGTGVAQIGDKVWVCCNYHPPGNYADKFNDEYVPRPVIKCVERY